MAQERRQERKNETLMMAKIDMILANQGKQDIEIAIIKTKSEGTEAHLKTLNGKVYNMESRQQVIEGSVAVNSQTIKTLAESSAKQATFWERNWEKLFWFVLASAFTVFLAKYQ
jgi:hypothetical protein